ncbi:GtrA family protein [Candidatus Saccharibacteria bacterium]|nr:MAG: GtrA family protein [Candidatus Saccharibacteria bacterium]
MKRAKKLTKKQRRQAIQFAEYMVSGGAFFWTGYVVFFIADKGFGWDLWWAKLTANISGWIVNYLLQRYWVFNSKRLSKHQTQVTERYIFITLVNFLLDYIIVAALQSAGITPYIGQFGSAGFFTVWNYFWYRFWVFPEHTHRHKRHATV